MSGQRHRPPLAKISLSDICEEGKEKSFDQEPDLNTYEDLHKQETENVKHVIIIRSALENVYSLDGKLLDEVAL